MTLVAPLPPMTEDVELRPARDWEEVRRAAIGAGRTFGGRDPEGPFFFERTVRAPTLALENTLLLLVDGRIVSQLQVYDRGMILDGVRAWIGAIGNVYTLPEYQRQGFGGRLLEYARDYLDDRGYVLSVLRTGTPAFYRTAGWEPVPFDRHRVDDPEPVGGKAAAFEPFEPAALDRLMQLYRNSRGTVSGSFHRPRVLWTDWILDPSMEVLPGRERLQLYRPGGEAEGYLAWEGGDDGVTCLEVGFDGADRDRESFLRSCWDFLVGRTDGAVEWHPPVPDAVAAAGGVEFDSETRAGDMVQVHAPEELSRLTRGAVADEPDLVAHLPEDFYWSNVDSF
jgi:GNAT superfamily N-acetyltransferase